MSTPAEQLLEVAWYMSKYGLDNPPPVFGVDQWNEAYALFYPRFGAGKTSEEFYNSLKNCRDRFDSWMPNPRRGWRNSDGTPKKLPAASQRVMERMNALAEHIAKQHVLSLIAANPFEQAQQDVQHIWKDKNLDETTRERLVAARLGQGDFRKECLILYPVCPITGIAFLPMLRASHIKPWSACSTGKERLDPYNGLMLAAHIDVLFDQGWMSFEDDGRLLFSKELSNEVIKQLQLPSKIPSFTEQSKIYLKWHRENVLRVAGKKRAKKAAALS
ncbi:MULTISPECIES: HNH endonuclease [Kosakonia]|uniref:HNH endonuclease n=1 Tax=Kosakonia TaxID=1330547 RepID=UPI0005EFBEB6|nr:MULTISPECIES: HNH endonuclease [Kosakonia]RCX02839.1 HNH endonuclease [Kosakonia sp. AG348]